MLERPIRIQTINGSNGENNESALTKPYQRCSFKKKFILLSRNINALVLQRQHHVIAAHLSDLTRLLCLLVVHILPDKRIIRSHKLIQRAGIERIIATLITAITTIVDDGAAIARIIG